MGLSGTMQQRCSMTDRSAEPRIQPGALGSQLRIGQRESSETLRQGLGELQPDACPGLPAPDLIGTMARKVATASGSMAGPLLCKQPEVGDRQLRDGSSAIVTSPDSACVRRDVVGEPALRATVKPCLGRQRPRKDTEAIARAKQIKPCGACGGERRWPAPASAGTM